MSVETAGNIPEDVDDVERSGSPQSSPTLPPEPSKEMSKPHNDTERNPEPRPLVPVMKQTILFVSVALGALVAMTVALGIFLTEEEPLSQVQQLLRRREAIVALLDPLYKDSEGGTNVFERSSPFASADRIAALEWLAFQDPAGIELPSPPPTRKADATEREDYEERLFKIRQRYVLAVLYMATNGQGWQRQHEFLTGIDECQWQTVGPYVEAVYSEEERKHIWLPGVACNEQGRIQRVRLAWDNLSGTIPHELSLFSDDLEHLVIPGGSLHGSIPSSLSKLTNLKTLSLNDNCLSGEIPAEIMKFPELRKLYIHNNNYELTVHPGSLSDFCDAVSWSMDRFFAPVRMDCPDYDPSTPPLDCDCCNCCNPEVYECAFTDFEETDSTFSAGLSKNGYAKSSEQECISIEQKNWIARECPCMYNSLEEYYADGGDRPEWDSGWLGICTTDCQREFAIPSYHFG